MIVTDINRCSSIIWPSLNHPLTNYDQPLSMIYFNCALLPSCGASQPADLHHLTSHYCWLSLSCSSISNPHNQPLPYQSLPIQLSDITSTNHQIAGYRLLRCSSPGPQALPTPHFTSAMRAACFGLAQALRWLRHRR